jgi:REP element-mobilizing transposase RayT
MGYDNLRKGRVSLPGHVYFITTATYERTPFFLDLYAARLVVCEMRMLHEARVVESLAWVLMPDHLHWLIQLGQTARLADVMRRLKARSTHAINRLLGRTGPVWQRAYYDHALRREEALRDVARYIVANPLRARLVMRLGEYPLWDAKWL